MLNMEAGSYYDADTAGEAQVVLTGLSGQRWSIGGVKWTYSTAAVTAGSVTIWSVDTANASNVIFSVDASDTVGSFYSDEISFAEPVKFPSNTTIIFELASGGSSVVGKINVLGAKAV